MTASQREFVWRGVACAIAVLMLPLAGCPAPWADREAVQVRANRSEEERDRGEFVIEGDKIIFERRHIARYTVIEDTIDGRKIYIFHGKVDNDPYFGVLGAECPACASIVLYDENRRDFRCPFCGSRYDQQGKPTFGPAKAGLERWQVDMIDNRLISIQLKRDPKYTTDAPGKRT